MSLITATITIATFFLGGANDDTDMELKTESVEISNLEWYEAYAAKIEAQRIVDVFNLTRYIFPIHKDDFVWDGVRGALTSPFGERDPSEIGGLGDVYHEGLDLWGVSEVATWQGRVVAVAGGVILNHWLDHSVKGKYIEILHDDGSITEYAHLSKSYIHEIRVLDDGSRIPWRVERGDVIGRIGNTGLSKGKLKYKTHLHFALRIPNTETGELEYVNPLVYITIPEVKE